jgi:type VI secretion system secreted protein VgrG
MSTYKQANRMLTVTTPLGDDKLLLVGLSGTESLSQLFRMELDLIATNETEVPFDQILGKKVTAHIAAPGNNHRHFSGICNRISQGGRDQYFTSYRAEIVPEVWFLTHKSQSRIFQAKTVPQILQKVLEGFQVSYKLTGHYEPRDYCVQYRETDFNFASRLMEEEGIFYFFEHAAGGHTMHVADNPGAHLPVPFGTTVEYAPLAITSVEEDRITEWEKAQDLRSMKFLLWDHCFELPHKHLEAEKPITESVQAGKVSHKLRIGNSDRLEIYDWPGEYAQRFDGVGPGREERPQDVQKIFQDNRRTVDIRMQQEAATCLSIAGSSRLRQLSAGHRFTLNKHFNADGEYILTAVHHVARMSANYRSGEADEIAYQNSFSCMPSSLPFRPQRITPKPVVQGTQTAVVVGPKGEEVYTDKYGRVKVQFHWDREGKNDEKSSCWIRVGQLAAGKRWGASSWPRIGQEVIVDYLEGDPDQPIIVGTVYNADQMPPYLGKSPDSKHPDENLISGLKSNTSKGGVGFNELRFFDAKGKEQIFVHAERNMDARVKHDSMEWVLNNRHLIVGESKTKDKAGDQCEEIWRDKHLHVHRHQAEHIEGNYQLLIGKGEAQGGNFDLSIEKNRSESVGGALGLSIGGDRQEKIGANHVMEAGQEIHLKAGMKVVIEAGMELTIKGPGGFVKIDAMGVTIEGTMVKINCGGSSGSAKSAKPASPKDAKPIKPTEADDAVTGQKSCQ